MIFNFSFSGTASSFKNLASGVEAPLQHEEIVIDKKEVKGTIRRAELETGLYLVYWNLQVNEDFTFINQNKSRQAFYFLTYFFNSQLNYIETKKARLQMNIHPTPCTLLEVANKYIKLAYKAGTTVNFLCISFTEYWLKNHLGNSNDQVSVFVPLLSKKESVSAFETSILEQMLAKRLVREFTAQSYRLAIKCNTYNLLDSFVRKQIKTKSCITQENKYTEVIKQIEHKMVNALHAQLPTINSLSKEFLVSPTTLKREFKQHYGKGIYEYYLDKKIQLAEMLLKTGTQTITEIAYQLGYESVSHFIALFKKHTGYCPSALKQLGKQTYRFCYPFLSVAALAYG